MGDFDTEILCVQFNYSHINLQHRMLFINSHALLNGSDVQTLSLYLALCHLEPNVIFITKKSNNCKYGI